MIPYEISVLGDRFLFYSLPSDDEAAKVLELGVRCIILLPSLDADFRIVGCEMGGKPLCDYYSAAVCAAAHLTLKQGLPLSEIGFETPQGFLKIFCTGDGLFHVAVDKCKLLLSKSIEICGCESDVYTVLAHGMFCVMRICDVTRFDKKALRRLASVSLPLPSAVVLTSMKNSTLSVRTYADYNQSPPSSVLEYAAAAFCECASAEAKFECGKILFGDYSSCQVKYSSVFMTVKPAFATLNTKYNDGIV